MAELSGLSIVVTRPRQHARDLMRRIEAHGGAAISYPAIEIVALEDQGPLNRLISRLDQFDLAVFVSPIAVDRALGAIRPRREWPSRLRIATVGASTAAAVREHGLEVAFVPAKRFDSESLLALPAMQEVAGQHVVIFRGMGGRELLAQTLKARGAEVEYAECYRRTKPTHRPARLFQAGRKVDIVIVTSVDGLGNLVDIVGPQDRLALLSSSLAVASERISRAAQQLGWQGEVVVASGANDDALLAAVMQWHAKRSLDEEIKTPGVIKSLNHATRRGTR